MFFALSKIITLFLNPLLWVALSGLAGLFFRRDKHPKARRRCMLAACLLLLVFSNPAVLQLAWRAWEIPPLNPTEITQPYEYGIVLGGYSDSMLGTADKLVLGSEPNRLTDAIRLYKTGRVKKLILVGGNGSFFEEGVAETPQAARFLLDLGIPQADILLDDQSRNTHENAMRAAELLDKQKQEQPSLLITSAFHMRRSSACFRKFGVNVVPYSTDARATPYGLVDFRNLIPNPWALAQWQFLLREWVGFAAYKATNRI